MLWLLTLILLIGFSAAAYAAVTRGIWQKRTILLFVLLLVVLWVYIWSELVPGLCNQHPTVTSDCAAGV